jgi:hypothetical protein
MKIQITDTHNAGEIPGSLAGSKRSSASRRTNQSSSANIGGIESNRLRPAATARPAAVVADG